MYPVVALRPSTSTLCAAGMYAVHNNIFLPTEESVDALIRFLEGFDLSAKAGIGHLDEKWVAVSKAGHVSARAVLSTTERWGCNILGGVFLDYIASCDFQIVREIGEFAVNGADTEFYKTLYPGMLPYLEGSIPPESELGRFWEGVVFNNTGVFRVLEVDRSSNTLVSNLTALAYLKRVFREGLRQCVQSGVSVVDNAVHTSENVLELSEHMCIFNRGMHKE